MIEFTVNYYYQSSAVSFLFVIISVNGNELALREKLKIQLGGVGE